MNTQAPLARSHGHWPILGLLLVAVMMRLPHLDGSFWLDEAAQALESVRPLHQQLDITPDFQPPLLHFLVHFAAQIHTSEWWLRLWGAVLPGIATIGLTYVLGRAFISRRAGLVASALLSTSSFHIFYSQELRPYALPAFIATASWWTLTQWLQNPSKYTWLGWYTLCTVGGLYASYLYPFFLLSQIIFIAWQERHRWVAYGSALSVAALAFLPWLPYLLKQLEAGNQVRVSLPGWDQVVSFSQLKVMPLTLGKFLFGVLDLEISAPFIIMTGAFVIPLSVLGIFMAKHVALKSSKKIDQSHGLRYWLILLSCWLLIPLVASWVFSFFIPVVQPKRILYLLPALYLAIATLTTFRPASLLKLAGNLPLRAVQDLVLFSLLITNVWGTVQYYTNEKYQREDWRSLHQEIVSRFPQERVTALAVFVFPEPFAPWRWYDDGSFPTLSTGTLHIDQVSDLPTTLKPIFDHDYLVTFDYLTDLTDPDHRLLAQLRDFGYKEVTVLVKPNIGFVRIYAHPTAVLSHIPQVW